MKILSERVRKEDSQRRRGHTLNGGEGGQNGRKGECEKDPPLSEVSGNKSLHLSSAGGESAVQTTEQILLSLLSIHTSSHSSFSQRHKH